MTSGEMEATRKFILSDQSHVKTAMAVFDTWPSVRDSICKKFFENLKTRIVNAGLLKGQVDLINRDWEGYGNILLSRRSWDGFVVALATDNKREPSDWYVGVFEDEEVDESRRDLIFRELDRNLGGGIVEDSFPWSKWLDRYKNWYEIVPDLYDDLNKTNDGQIGGEITGYYVELVRDLVGGLSNVME